MRRRAFPVAGLVLAAVVLVWAACSPGQGTPTPTRGPTQEESQRIAQQYVVDDETFQFDGIDETLKLAGTETLRCPYCWAFLLEFQSRHSGYGNRTGQTLLQVITPHTARVVVESGVVTSAVMDSKWDMMAEKAIE